MKRAGETAKRMPAEWEPHAATWLAYPHLASDWPGKLGAARWAFAEFVRKLQEHETVRLLVRDAAEGERARSAIRRAAGDAENLDIHHCPTDRAWVRDSGPTFVTSGGQRFAVCWKFDAWGRYANWTADAKVGAYIAGASGVAAIHPRVRERCVALEGGAIDGNGAGTLLTTEQCLLSRKRRGRGPSPSREEFESMFRDALGVRHVVWLGRGIAGDDTSGHVDTLARFTGPRTVAAIIESDSRDENFTALQDNLGRLRQARDQDGRPLEIVELPMPRPLRFDGYRLPASYANFYVANDCVLVPTFNDPNDSVALRILGECFRDREVCGIHCVDLALGLGTLHCLAQQEPEVLPRVTDVTR